MPTNLARRVARRHAHEAAVVFRDVPAERARIEYSSGARISAIELARALEPTTGRLAKMVFHRQAGGPPTEVGWAAVDPNGGVVSGTLIFRVAVAEHEVTSWVEASIDPPGTSVIVDPGDLVKIAPASTTSAAARVALRYMRRREGLVPVDGGSDEPLEEEDRP